MGMMDLPPLLTVRQTLVKDHIADVPGDVTRQLRLGGLVTRLRPGSRIAITAGSRGINHIAAIVTAVAAEVRAAGALPFVVPAMGSHGGATADGQRQVLAEYGITEEVVGCPVLSDMDPILIGHTGAGVPVYMDRNAYQSDGVIVVARVKCHSSFRAPVESGMCKMIAVGLGKQRGAEAIHRYGLGPIIEEVAKVSLATGKIIMGLAVVENSYEETYRVQAVAPKRIPEEDRALLVVANSLFPRIAFDPLDLLIIDWMGKNISGSGMDYNVIGLWRRIEGMERKPFFTRIAVLNLTPESAGNAIGVGAADFTTQRLFGQIDLRKTYMNALTANAPHVAKIPLIMSNDREAIETALASATPQGAPRVVRIDSTLHLAEYRISPALLDEARALPNLEVVGQAEPMRFDNAGNLT